MTADDLCGAPHPEMPGVVCTRKQGKCLRYHAQGRDIAWDNPTPHPAEARGTIAATRLEILRTTEPVRRAEGVPEEALAMWQRTRSAWLAEATSALRQVCLDLERFTTKDLWPLVDAPYEKRAMVIVIRRGLKAGWMVEDSAVREKGVYRTRDGVEFPLNKLVPVYRSLVYQGSPELS